jgi:hypothetical protein
VTVLKKRNQAAPKGESETYLIESFGGPGRDRTDDLFHAISHHGLYGSEQERDRIARRAAAYAGLPPLHLIPGDTRDTQHTRQGCAGCDTNNDTNFVVADGTHFQAPGTSPSPGAWDPAG